MADVESLMNPGTLQAWVEEFWKVYKDVDEGRSRLQLWGYAVEDAARLGEAIRVEQWKTVREVLPHVFCWLCGLVQRCRHADPWSTWSVSRPLQQIVFDKYPGVCWLCGECPCGCPSYGLRLEEDADFRKRFKQSWMRRRLIRDAKRRNRVRMLRMGLDQWIDEFAKIYGGILYQRSWSAVGFHFLEEVGEVERSLRRLDCFAEWAHIQGRNPKAAKYLRPALNKERNNLLGELADVFSWIAAVVIKLNYVLEAAPRHPYLAASAPYVPDRLSKMILERYRPSGHGAIRCKWCQDPTCSKHCELEVALERVLELRGRQKTAMSAVVGRLQTPGETLRAGGRN